MTATTTAATTTYAIDKAHSEAAFQVRHLLTSDLTIRGVTKAVTLDVSFLGKAKDPRGNERLAFEGETTIDRKDFVQALPQA